jgi:hypothetical protein
MTIPLLPVGYPAKKKKPTTATKEILELSNTIDQINLADIYRIFHTIPAEHTLFSTTHRTFSKIDHILGYKSSLNKYKNIEITYFIFSDYNGKKPKTNGEKNYRKIYEFMENEQYTIEGIRKEIKKFPEAREN